jgi:hypothetical protein
VRFIVPQKHKGNKVCASTDLSSVSRLSEEQNRSSASFGRSENKQHSGKFALGNTGGELGGSDFAWNGNGRGKASQCKAARRREISFALGNLQGSLQPKEGCQMPWDVPIGNLGNHKWEKGLRLWVRETFAEHFIGDGGIAYRADGPEWDEECNMRWSSPLFMPRTASRITLEIESVRVERLIEIASEDAIAEGVIETEDGWYADSNFSGMAWMKPDGAYRQLWESINGTGSWDANPWVWVIQFRRIQP